jgi:hypothetical protein
VPGDPSVTDTPPPTGAGSGGPLSLLVQANASLSNDFGEAMPVLFEVPVSPRRLSSWLDALATLASGTLKEVAASFLAEREPDAVVSVQVEGAAGTFQALPRPRAVSRLFGEVGLRGLVSFRLVPRDRAHDRLDLLVRVVTLRLDAFGIHWMAKLTDFEEQSTLRTPHLDSVHLLELQLQMADAESRPSLFSEIVHRSPRRASLILARGIPDPWATDTFRTVPLQTLPPEVLRPLLEHSDSDIRLRAENAVLFPPTA